MTHHELDWLDALLAERRAPIWPQAGTQEQEMTMTKKDTKAGGKTAQKPQESTQEAAGDVAAPATAKAAGKAPEAAAQEPEKASKAPAAAPGKSLTKPKLAPWIDSYLFKGDRTVAEIASMVESLATASELDIKGKDIQANVRARMIHHRKRGATVTKDAGKRIKVVPAEF